jgi:AmmeMemoRadiSam system protein B
MIADRGPRSGRDAVRPPAVAGQFYPSGARELTAALDSMFAGCSGQNLPGEPVALIAPHAGYPYSGRTAAEGYQAVRSGKFDCVVVLSPSHREYFEGVSVYPGRAYATPFGEMPVDGELRSAITSGDDVIRVSDAGHRDEHAVEVQLPFISRLFGAIGILPVVMGDQRREFCFHLGEKLSAVLAGRRALIVASTDLSHYHPYATAQKIDRRFAGLLAGFDYRGIMDELEAGTVEACGGGPAVAALMAAEAIGADRVVIAHQCNSGDTGADAESVVGYVSAVATAP